MFDTPVLGFQAVEGGLDLAGLPILVDPDDYEGIRIATTNLARDLERVSGQRSTILTADQDPSRPLDGAVLIGSIEKNTIIRSLITSGILDVRQIEGKWESCVTTLLNLPWAKSCLVIAGSDKRGTIFGVYNMTEQMGVSPWHWWADVPVKSHRHIHALPSTTYQGEPSVRYRGLFINDETPSLTSWVQDKFGGKYNSEFYKTVFELLLRLKANFLWPAMWSGYPNPGSSFFADDPENQKLADAYGIVVSTSHHEPMQRSTTEWLVRGDGEWIWSENKEKIVKFFEEGAARAQPYESLITLGMRGAGDKRIKADNPKETLADVLDSQRKIIRNTYGKEDGERQLMALYKEVLEYYEDGLHIPDDVTLIFPDDNFGNIRRLPTGAERKRSGGAGLYYHLEYVGRPRGYKWINTNSCGKIYQQLRTAYDHGANTVWVINVGDIKPVELPFTFAMHLAWDIHATTSDTIPRFMQQYCTREFGPDYASPLADLLIRHDRLLAIRKHEHIEADTLSVVNYREAEAILSRWTDLEAEAENSFQEIPTEYKAALFQLVLHPIKASRIYTELRITQAKNQLYGLQRRTTTNPFANRVLRLFDEDFDLSEQYHNSPYMGTKWNKIMRQPHYGYSTQTWHDPSRDLITGLCYIQPRQDSNPIAGQMGVSVEGHPGVRPGLINEETDRMQPSRNDLVPGLTVPPLSPYSAKSRYFEVYSRGRRAFHWNATVEEVWVQLSSVSGEVSTSTDVDQRVEVSIDWARVPPGYSGVIQVHIRSSEGDYEQVHVPVSNPHLPTEFHGFVESDGCVSIETGSAPLDSSKAKYYEHHPYLGRTTSGSLCLRPTIDFDPMDDNEIPFLTYDIFLFSSNVPLTIYVYFMMALETNPQAPLRYEVSLDGVIQGPVRLLGEPRSLGELPPGWSTAVMDGIWKRKHDFPIATVGAHRVGIRLLSENVVLEKVVVDVGGVRESYLGPPPSFKV